MSTGRPPAALPRTAVVLLSAGSGSRVGTDTNKVLLPLHGRPVLAWSLRAVLRLAYVEQVVVVHRSEDHDAVREATEDGPSGRVGYVEGGSTRHGSEWNALRALAGAVDSGHVDVVAIHDAARPLAHEALFGAVVAAAREHGGAIPVRRQPGLLTTAAAPRPAGPLVAVQTPQAFRAPELLAAYRAASRDGFQGTDTAACVERYTDLRIHGVSSPATNLKITFPEDVALAERLLSR